jgi:hypothetical protein
MRGVLVAMGLLLTASGSALALDLTRASLPIEYECRASRTGAIWRDEGGDWHSGALRPDKEPSRYLLQRYRTGETSDWTSACDRAAQALVDAEVRRNGYCLIRLPPKGMAQSMASVSLCKISMGSDGRSNSVLECGTRRVLDTDRNVLLDTTGLLSFLLHDGGMAVAAVIKSDCVRLDR